VNYITCINDQYNGTILGSAHRWQQSEAAIAAETLVDADD